jgi:hypothetical protein
MWDSITADNKEARMSQVALQRTIDTSANKTLDCSVLRARKAFEDLEGWVLSEAARALPIQDIEVEMERRSREINRLMLQAHLNERGTGYVGSVLHCQAAEGQVGELRARRNDPCEIVSIFGSVQANRTAYVAGNQAAVHPLDEQLNLPARSFSYEVQRRLVEETVRGPYDETVASLAQNLGVGVPKRSAEQVAADAAVDFEAFYQQRQVPSAESSAPIVVAAADGKGVPLVKPAGHERVVRRTKGQKANKKKMATVAAVFTIQPRLRTPEEVTASLFQEQAPQPQDAVRPEHKRVWASLRQSKDEVLAEVAREVQARDPQTQKTQVAVTDGERALQYGIQRVLPAIVLILDLLHVLEKLWAVAHALYGEGSAEAEAWVKQHVLMILRGQVRAVVRGIRQSVTKRGLKGMKRHTLLGVAQYLYRNRERMKYDQYLAQGWPIASGAVEGACKNLVKDRMERSGMRWQVAGAEAVLQLRALKLSGDWPEYWQFHIRQDQERLYGQRIPL